MRRRDVIVAGENFGMGSSRPALKALGLGCLTADSISGLFFRNCVSFGLLALESPGILADFDESDIVEIDLDRSIIRNAAKGITPSTIAIPKQLTDLMFGGGIMPLLESEDLIGPEKSQPNAVNSETAG